MTPKTNREKVKHIRAFDKEFNVKRSKELDFLLMLARYTNGPELTPEAWEELEELYQHVILLEEGDECPKKGPGDEQRPIHPQFMQRIDWGLLRDQKQLLLDMGEHSNETTVAEEDAITGIVHLIDAIQDYAVDVMGVHFQEVFNLSEETK